MSNEKKTKNQLLSENDQLRSMVDDLRSHATSCNKLIEQLQADAVEHEPTEESEERYRAMLDSHDKTIAYQSIDEDIIERKQAEKNLKQEILMRNTLLDNLPCIAMILKKGTREIVASNEAAKKIGAVPGKKCFKTCARRKDPCPFCKADEVWSDDKPRNLEVKYRGVYYEGIWVPLTDELFVHYIFDINKRKLAELQLETAKEDAEAANIVKSQFLANMSHEIRTPMTVITGFSEMLITEELTKDQLTYAEFIRNAGKSLLTIINDILDYSKIEAGKLEVVPTENSLKKILDDVSDIMRPLAVEKDLPFEIICSKNLPAIIQTDQGRLHQCLVNLVNNAIKFTKKGHVHLIVSVEERDAKSFIRFDIEDTGIGIPQDMQEHIFESFAQEEKGSTRKYSGTGLGLTITDQLAGLLGGQVSLTSRQGAGSTFSLVIPTGVQVTSMPSSENSKAACKTVPTEEVVHNYSGSVLIAEDDEGCQILTIKLFEPLGLEVTIAKDGNEAVEKGLTESFDLIFMDIRMPHLDGLMATEALREKGITTPIIALTAHAMEGDRKLCIQAGCDDYLSKPIEREKLLQILDKYLTIKAV